MLFSKDRNRKIVDIPLIQIRPCKSPARKCYNQDKLKELAVSIRLNGIIQPLTVRKVSPAEFEIISGECRFRAAAMCGETTVPCIIVCCDDVQATVLSLIENIQRTELNFFEEAEIISSVISNSSITKQELAELLGKRLSAVSSRLQFLEFGDEERNLILKAHLTERHARAVLRVPDKVERRIILSEIIEKNMNVSQSEEYINSILCDSKLRKRHSQHQKAIIKDVRIFENTIKKAVNMMRSSGIPAVTVQSENEDFIEYVVRVPKIKPNSDNTNLTA